MPTNIALKYIEVYWVRLEGDNPASSTDKAGQDIGEDSAIRSNVKDGLTVLRFCPSEIRIECWRLFGKAGEFELETVCEGMQARSGIVNLRYAVEVIRNCLRNIGIEVLRKIETVEQMLAGEADLAMTLAKHERLSISPQLESLFPTP